MFRQQKSPCDIDEELITACLQQNLFLVAKFKRNGADVNKVCSSGRTALGVAAEIGNVEMIKILLGLETTSTDEPGSCSTGASNMGYFVVVHSESGDQDSRSNEALQTSCFDINEFNDSLIQRIPGMSDSIIDWTEIMPELEWDSEIEMHNENLVDTEADDWTENYLWYANILSQLESLLPERSNDLIDSEDQIGLTALHYAASAGHTATINVLLEAGCKVNCEDSDNFTPLHLAAAKEQPETIRFLLVNGANPNHRSTDGITALHVSASRGHVKNVQVLISFGANVNAVDMADRTPLYVAVCRQHRMVVKLLIDSGSKVNLEEIHGYTPLYEAVCAQDIELVSLLLDAGSKLTQSHHLLHYAVLHGYEEMVGLLMGAGAIVNLRNEEGDTPLMLAVRTKKYSIASLLLQRGASVQLVNHVSRKTALLEAILGINSDCREFAAMFTLLEDSGWDMMEESNALHFAVMNENDHAVATLIRRWHIPAYSLFPDKGEACYRLLRKGKLFLVELLVYAGFNVYCIQRLQAAYPSMKDCCSYLVKNPLSLQQNARIAVRSILKPDIHKQLTRMKLPKALKSYIMLEDVRCPCEVSTI